MKENSDPDRFIKLKGNSIEVKRHMSSKCNTSVSATVPDFTILFLEVLQSWTKYLEQIEAVVQRCSVKKVFFESLF